MGHKDFVHLHLHTQYSLLDAMIKIDEIGEAVKGAGMPAVALTDHGNLFGAVQFHEKVMNAGVKPIIGCEVYVTPGSRFEKSPRPDKYEKGFHMTLLAENSEGYANLVKLVSAGFSEGFYYNPRLDAEILEEYSRGLIALSGCISGEPARRFLRGDEDGAMRALGRWNEIFSKGNYFIEVQDHGLEAERRVLPFLLDASERLEIPALATNDVHYLMPGDYEAHDVLLCIGSKATQEDEKRKRYGSDQFYLKTPEEMLMLFPERPDLVSRTVEIAERANVVFDFNKRHLPVFPLPPEEEGEFEYLEAKAMDGLKKKVGKNIPEKYLLRIKRELATIKSLGFSGYFLIVADFMEEARRRGIPLGPGRGSAAGALVAYSLGITEVDPIEYALLFERFLNAERIALPDIDIDFCQERRDEIISYVREKYGQDRVAQIITFGTMGAKAVVRDVARVMGVSFGEADRLAKLIPDALRITLDDAIKSSPPLESEAAGDYEKLFRIARRLEGLTRHASTHAAGVVISDVPLTELVPLYRDSEGKITTQFDMKMVEKLGLLKMDFLGLKTLTVMQEAARLLEERTGRGIDWEKIPLDDPETYSLLRSGETLGVFQLDSSGIREMIRRIAPETFEDISSVIALYRPGPLNLADDFIERKHGRQKYNYSDPRLEPILSPTYGIILYQEQAMAIAHEIGGLSMVEADHLRKAMGKKLRDVMESYREKFISGAEAGGLERRKAVELFDQIERFADYGFNRSHSIAYAIIAFRTAYLKAHHGAEFMAALLSSEMGDRDKMALYIGEAERMGLEVLRPSVTDGYNRFTPDKGGVRFGLVGVKNVGSAAAEAIVDERKRGGPFTSLEDFFSRMGTGVLNKRALESLAKSGALDDFGYSRRSLVEGLDSLMTAAQRAAEDRETGQGSLFGAGDFPLMPPVARDLEDYTKEERLAFEKELTGVYLSGHPLEEDREKLSRAATHEAAGLRGADGERAVLAGLILAVDESTDKRMRRMARARFEDLTGETEIVIFSSVFEETRERWRPGRKVVISGKVESDGRLGGTRLIADGIEELGKSLPERIGEIHLALKAPNDSGLIDDLKRMLRKNPGPAVVYIHVRENGGWRKMRLPGEYSVSPEPDLREELTLLLGRESVRFGRPGNKTLPS